MAVNHYHISHVIGSRMRHSVRGRFGALGTLQTTVEYLKQTKLVADQPADVDHADDKKLVRSFEDVREGAAPDWILWDKSLARRFAKRAHELGINAKPVALNRRLLAIRKNPQRYAERGVIIMPTPNRVPHETIVNECAAAIEFALVKLRYRYGVSIDDILIDPQLADEFEIIAQSIAATASSIDLRRGALYMRKTRHFDKHEKSLLSDIDVAQVDSQFNTLGTLLNANTDSLPSATGLFEVSERQRVLYISSSDHLKRSVEQFVNGSVLRAMTNDFWKPDPNLISVRVIPSARVLDLSVNSWCKFLIAKRSPVFNLPLAA